MKKIIFALAAIMALAACGNKQAATPTSEGNVERSEVPFEVAKNYENKRVVLVNERETNYFPAIDRYLADSIGSKYAKGEHCVPIHSIVRVDERNAEDILVWGDFWVFNYNQAEMRLWRQPSWTIAHPTDRERLRGDGLRPGRGRLQILADGQEDFWR